MHEEEREDKRVTGAHRVGVGLLIWKDDELLLVRRRTVHGSGTWSTSRGAGEG